ncbi:MAG: LamG domain-containing protein [Ignavibacteriaceae bacterium]
MKRIIFSLFLISLMNAGFAQQPEPIGYWAFDNVRSELKELEMVRGETFLPRERFGYVTNSVNNVESDLNGKYYKQVPGVINGAVLLDGNTAYIEVEPENVPHVEGDFSVEAWVAMGAYPNNVSPIVDNQRDPAEGYFNGYFFGLDALGRLILRIATDGRDEELVGTNRIPLKKWTHVAGTYSPENGMRIYIDGELEGEQMPNNKFTSAQDQVNILIGRSRTKMRPYGTIRPHGTQPYDMFYDGLLDEIKIYDEELTSKQVKDEFSSGNSDAVVDLMDRVMPTGPLSKGYFGAISTNLEYYPAYDALWHVGDGNDVVVRFDQAPVEFVFWKGANYQAHLVTEKGFWFNNGFNEGWSDHGSAEPMSDKQTRYSHVMVLESNEARAVVKWRYALIDNWDSFAFFDPTTRWGDWTEETFYIYPDMVAVREDALYSNAPRAEHEWQESMVVPGPGQRPEDLLEYAALTLGNTKGEFHTYSWENDTPPHFPPAPKNPNIQLVNMKSEWKPFSILRAQDNPSIDVYSGEIRRDVSVFPWWNHWPVAQKPTDGRYAMAADRPSHSSLSHWFWDAYNVTDNSMTKLLLTGFTNKTAEELLPLAKSWENPPEITAANGLEIKYDQVERAFNIKADNGVDEINFELAATKDSPVLNPAFVITDWGRDGIELYVDNEKINKGKDFRIGYEQKLDDVDLVAWIKYYSEEMIKVRILRSN